MQIALAFQEVVKPYECACCGQHLQTYLKAEGRAAVLEWVERKDRTACLFPYCNACLRHTKLSRSFDFTAAFLSVVTLGVYFAYFLVRRWRAKAAMSADCTCPGLAVVVLGADETSYNIELLRESFARSFVIANRGRVRPLDSSGRERLALIDVEEGLRRANLDSGRPLAPVPQPRAARAANRAPRHPVQVWGPPPSSQPAGWDNTVRFNEPNLLRPKHEAAAPVSGLSALLAERSEPQRQPGVASRVVQRPRVVPLTVHFGAPRVWPARPTIRNTTIIKPIAVAPALPAAQPARFFGIAETLVIAGRVVSSPLVYVAEGGAEAGDAGTIVTGLSVGDAAEAAPLPHWPSYSSADPNQRARYLDWLAGNRVDPEIPIGYVFLFFYGLERRVLDEELDEELIRQETNRLRSIYVSPAFQKYSSELLVHLALRHVDRLDSLVSADVDAWFGSALPGSFNALAALTAWYCRKREPLPAHYAEVITRGLDTAKLGVVADRAAVELSKLFSVRYQAAFGSGIVLEAAKLPISLRYSPASPSLFDSNEVELPNVLGRASQFKKVVEIWNRCVDDLRRASGFEADGKKLTADGWAALPADLRAKYDHPDQDSWDAAVASLPVLGPFHLATAGQLAGLLRLDRAAKVTAAQLKKIGRRAADVGYAIEPDPRIQSKGTGWDSDFLVWRWSSSAPSDPRLHAAVFAMVSIGAAVGLADGQFAPEEQGVLGSFVAEAFALDEEMGIRVEAMMLLVERQPRRIEAVAKKLSTSVTPEEKRKLASVLVAIAAADGVIGDAEHQTLRKLYLNLGLSELELWRDVGRTGVAPASDKSAEPPKSRSPRKTLTGVALDAALLASIGADTRDVARMLAEVFDADDDAEDADEGRGLSGASPAPQRPHASEAIAKLASGLDARYHAVLEQLLSKDRWPQLEVKEVASRHGLLPGAILVTVNAWADDELGDFLIDEDGGWNINRGLAKVQA